MDNHTEQPVQEDQVKAQYRDEVEQWLKEIRCIEDTSQHSDLIDRLASKLESGHLVIHWDGEKYQRGTIEHKLKFPLETDGAPIERLYYRPRLTRGQQKKRMQGVGSDNHFAMMTAMEAAIANQPVPVMDRLDSVDASIADSIVVFFME